MKDLFLYLIVFLSISNLIRMMVYLISSDVYALKLARDRYVTKDNLYYPTVTVVIPAYNEENTIIRSLDSVFSSEYPADKLKIIVANDGSKDRTAELVDDYIAHIKTADETILPVIQHLNQPNRGKAAALNNALEHHVNSELVMCLDSDSYLTPSSLKNAVQHFRDQNVVALSSNVNIIEDGTLLALIQRFEYLVCYQMKRGQALLGIEYIVGGIGSMFRTNMLRQVEFYDTNTMTEDIDLTMKILLNKERNERIAYAYDSIVYTEAAHSVKELLTQRYRWKFGRSQTFLKNGRLFFSKQSQHRKRLSWIALPYSLFQDLLFFIEPLVIGWFLYLSFVYLDTKTLATALVVITLYTLTNVWASNHLSFKNRLRLSYYAPPMYILMFVMTFVEYYALIKASVKLPTLKASIRQKHVTWTSPTRRAAS